ncbi:MAG: phosphate starvation-inducible protein PhoH, partial [Firmicutes bacterium]|nr:phosphate starvation-inducible protein PhoH [Bacillota bacterium]
MTEIITQRLELGKEEDSLYLLGRFDENLDLIERHFNVRVIPRGNELIVEGEKNEVSKLHLLFSAL